MNLNRLSRIESEIELNNLQNIIKSKEIYNYNGAVYKQVKHVIITTYLYIINR